MPRYGVDVELLDFANGVRGPLEPLLSVYDSPESAMRSLNNRGWRCVPRGRFGYDAILVACARDRAYTATIRERD